MKKFFAKLIGWQEQKRDFPKMRFQSDQKDEAKMARERHDQTMAGRDRKFVSERTIPTEGEIVGPSDSASEERTKA